MSLWFQVTVDAADPHTLADWWAETLGWQVEESDETFIRRMIAEGRATEADTTVHRGTLVWRTGAAVHPRGQGEDPRRMRILFQAVPEPKTVKNRMHLDLRAVPGTDLDALRAELLRRGATELHRGSQGPYSWVTMTDPEGNEFCV